MERTESLLRFLHSETFERPKREPEPGSRPFVTISRQAGAGGRTLAEALLGVFARRGAQELAGWQWCDRELCESLAKDPRLGTSLEALLDERFRGRLEDYLTSVISGAAPQIKIFREVFRTERSLAAVGRVILVGRGGASATQGYPGGVHVRLVGSRRVRVERVAVRESWSRQRAERWVDEQDEAREALLKEYFGASINDPLLFTATFNTDVLPIMDAAEAVAELVLARSRSAVAA